MVKIAKYQASQGLQGGSALQTNVANPVGAALKGLGGAIDDVGTAATNVADYNRQREEKKQDFKTENDYRRLQMQLGSDMDAAADNIAEDGTGFHKDFTEKVYAPARNQFLAGVPERLREKYQTILGPEGADTEAWSIKAAKRESEQTNTWYKGQLKTGQDELATAISLDPDGYDTILKSGIDAIDASGLPTADKTEQKQAWTRMAQIAHLNKTLETRPEQVLRDLGADPRMLAPTTQFEILKKAVTHQESGGNPNAISPKGAIGRMQVMPRTAVDISKWMKDGLIDANMSDARITEILSNPVTNEKYGTFYLQKMIREYSGKGGIEAALVGYNAGPGTAQKWIESGFDNSKLPAETRNYVKSVMGNLPSMAGSKFAAAPKGDPNDVTLTFAKGRDDANLSPDVSNRVKTAFAGLGISNVKITSGFRDEGTNARVGGAKGSQHIHGNAMDIDVSGYSIAERVNIIKSLSAAGITGLGVGTNIIHADVGGRRAWGYARSDGGGAVPKWAEAAIAEHLENRASAPPERVGVGGRYAGLPYADRQKYIHAADQEVTRQTTEARKATATQRVELQTAMGNELASLQTSGKSTDLVDDTAVSTVLGEDDYIKWVANKERALRTYTARDGIAGMTLEEMDDRLSQYRPDPGSPTFADDQKVEAAVQKEIDRVQKLRSARPAEAAMLYPDVRSAWDKVQANDNPAPGDVQDFVRLNLERQKEFGLKPGSEQPVPRSWSVQIGQQLSKIPEIKGRNMPDVNASIIVMYDSLKKVFGDYTDEVIINALKEYKGVGPNTATLLSGYMEAIQAGGDPLARVRGEADRALDKDQVESSGGFWSGVGDFLRGETRDGKTAAPVDDPGDGGVNPDRILRAMTTIENLGEDMSPEQEESLIRRYGKTTVDAAKARIGDGS